MLNYVKHAATKRAEYIHLEEKAILYTQWLILPSSAEIGRRLTQKILKDAKFEIRKAAKKVSKECNQIDIMMAGENKGEVLDIYDDMLTDFRKEMEVQEENILDCCKEHYEDEILAETLFAYVITKVHRAIVYHSSLSLKRGHSMVNIEGCLKYVTILLDGIADLGRALEKKAGIKETIFMKHTEEDKDNMIVGLSDVIGDYTHRLLNDIEMHQHIQTPFMEHQKKVDEDAQKLGEEILEEPISVLECETDFFEKNNIKYIKDLYGDNGLREFECDEKTKKMVIKALRNHVIKRVYV